jgi:hypothetical protein
LTFIQLQLRSSPSLTFENISQPQLLNLADNERQTTQMGLFNIFKKPERPLDFSDDNVKQLATFTDTLGDTLIKAGYGFYVDHLSQIKLAAERHDEQGFKQYVVSRELFGGAGAMWEIWIEDKELRIKFESLFCQFVDLLKKIGISNGRINQIRKDFLFTDKD